MLLVVATKAIMEICKQLSIPIFMTIIMFGN